ncbi:hypothetical protein AB0G54_33865 [Streptomyces yokosukanensis]|uniref:hypothetical protein n=1 Tax=Streptomyces yokosukanensis TaxID=67386 RepID=UPI0034300914
MPALTADRSPGQLVAEFDRLIGVDWPTVWAGVPQDPTGRAHWCAGFGWRALWFESGLWVRTAEGGRLLLASDAPGHPVARVEHTVWAGRAEDPVENRRVEELAEARWSACLDALNGTMGFPRWEGRWDAPDVPEPPGHGPWHDLRRRREHKDPYRAALWWFSVPQAPVIQLRMTLAPGTPSGPTVANARITLACHGPAAQKGDAR